MTLGIAIPTYIGHIQHLTRLLDAISKSTVLPEQVSVSVSSFDGELDLSTYPFELIISKTLDYKNPSQNRNIAASKLTTDIISFIDGDDLPHINRNEFILKSFEIGSSVVTHDYHTFQGELGQISDYIGDLIYLKEYIDTYISYDIFPRNKDNHLSYHNAHITISKNIFDKFKYDENEELKYREDSEFNSRLVKNGHKICYISNKLSYYRH